MGVDRVPSPWRRLAPHGPRVERGSGAGRSVAATRVLVALLAAAAWVALAAWSAGPYARYLAHEGWFASGALGAVCEAVPAGALVVPALLHALSWVLMIAAMMVPTVAPLLARFARLVHARPDAGHLVALVVAGYLVAWTGFGLLAHAGDEALRALASRWPWLALHGAGLGAAVLVGAGLFQLSALKRRCLDRCRSTLGFVASHWHGRAPAREALRLGLDHGLFCVGCCFALMLVMFVVGTASLAWMLALAAVMAAEKNLPAGPRLRVPVGVALLASGALLLLAPL